MMQGKYDQGLRQGKLKSRCQRTVCRVQGLPYFLYKTPGICMNARGAAVQCLFCFEWHACWRSFVIIRWGTGTLMSSLHMRSDALY